MKSSSHICLQQLKYNMVWPTTVPWRCRHGNLSDFRDVMLGWSSHADRNRPLTSVWVGLISLPIKREESFSRERSRTYRSFRKHIQQNNGALRRILPELSPEQVTVLFFFLLDAHGDDGDGGRRVSRCEASEGFTCPGVQVFMNTWIQRAETSTRPFSETSRRWSHLFCPGLQASSCRGAAWSHSPPL